MSRSLTFLLDIVEVSKSHIGMNLSNMFANILEVFHIKEKVRIRIYG